MQGQENKIFVSGRAQLLLLFMGSVILIEHKGTSVLLLTNPRGIFAIRRDLTLTGFSLAHDVHWELSSGIT